MPRKRVDTTSIEPVMGEPPKALKYAETLAVIEAKIAAAVPEIVDTLIDRAKSGDLNAARYLCDRFLGRPAGVPSAPVEDRRLPYTGDDAERDARHKAHMDNLADTLGFRPN